MSMIKRRKVNSDVLSDLKKKKKVSAPVSESESDGSPEPAGLPDAETPKEHDATKSFKDLVGNVSVVAEALSNM